MDVALVQYAENDVDDHQRSGDQYRFIRQRGLERLRIALEGADHGRRHAEVVRHFLNGVDRLTERHAWRQIEGDGNGRELARMGNQQRTDMAVVDVDQGRERDELSGGRRFDVKLTNGFQFSLQRRQRLEHHIIRVVGEVLRHVVLAERIVQRVVDDLRLDAETGRRVAIDGDGYDRRSVLRIGGDVSQFRQFLEPVHQARDPRIELLQIRILKNVLERAARDAAADGYVLSGLQEEPGAGHLRELGAQPVDNLRSRGIAVVTQL